MLITQIQEKNLFSLRNLLLDSDSHQVLSVTEDDVAGMFKNASTVALQTGYGDSLEEAFDDLGEPEIDSSRISTAIIVIRCVVTYPLSISEIPFVNAYINKFMPEAFVRWGFSEKEVHDKNIKVLCLTGY